MTTTTCEGCTKPMNPVEAMGGTVCLACCQARAATVGANGRCKCGNKRRAGEQRTVGGILINGVRRGARTFVPCLRCLGTIRTVS